MSAERLQLGLLTLFEKRALCDVTITVGGKEILAHKAVLAAGSTWFEEQLKSSGTDPVSVTLKHNYKAVHTLIRFMYFGGLADDSLGPLDGLDMLQLSQELGVKSLDAAELAAMVVPRLTPENCIAVLQHPGLSAFPEVQAGVTEYVGRNLLLLLKTMEDQLLCIPCLREERQPVLSGILKSACHTVGTDADTERVVRFCLNWCLTHLQLESACDLLRETKQWAWGSGMASVMRSAPGEEPSMSPEWTIPQVSAAMQSTPARIVVGNFFDWTIRLDYGAEDKLRIVYESATPREDQPRCINRFPAALFEWRVIYRGQDVFNEKPVFICFPENVSLHWSTTLPVSAADLLEDDDIKIMVNMAENPMLSLVLYYFSADLKTTVFSEDILNRLPHIEYRCLSSYSLIKTHVSAN